MATTLNLIKNQGNQTFSGGVFVASGGGAGVAVLE